MTERPEAADQATEAASDAGTPPGSAEGKGTERVVIRNRRKIDPSGGKIDPTGGKSGSSNPAGPTPSADSSGDDDPAGKSADAETTDGEATSEETVTPVVDDVVLAEVLEADKPAGAQTPVVDEPAVPANGDSTSTDDVEVTAESSETLVEVTAFGAELEALRAELDERTRDLQRVSAEYANYRKRVDRDRGVAAEQTTGVVLSALLPILDDLDRAREHGDLVGPFGTVAEQLITAVGKFGLTALGEKGDSFDPTRHEAVAHLTSAEVTEPTCVEVMRRGYLLNDRLLRPALVAVADPE